MPTKLILLALMTAACAVHAQDLPAWLRDAMSKQSPESAKPTAFVLYDESNITVAENGTTITRATRAVRILKREGAGEAIARAIYNTDTGKVKDFRAWLIRPSGEAKKYGKNEVLDLALVNNDVYNEVRMKTISARGEADPGSIFAFEFEMEDKSVFTQFERTFQEDIPVALARFSVALPPGWKVDTRTYNSPSLKSASISGRHTWELRDLPALETEPFGPSTRSLAPRVAVSALPSGDAKTAVLKSFSAWSEVARWLHEIAEPQLATDNALLEKAQSLTRNAKSDWERIEAVGRFVQSVQYVSIQTGVGRGGGYKPRPATLVLARNYGDCKDKANLMRAMLKVVGVESYPVVIYSGDRTYVQQDWPSPQQFNHCIFAARLKDDRTAPAVAIHPKLGRMIFFDPTDEHTRFGLLPPYQEDSLALVVAPETEELLRMPASKPNDNLVERTFSGSLDGTGVLKATLRETSNGHAADEWRRLQQDASGFRKRVESWLSASMTGAQIVALEPRSAPHNFEFEVKLQVDGFAQSMAGNLLMFRPAPLHIGPAASFREKTRKQPLILEPRALNDSFTLALPSGFAVDELPPPVKMQSAYATFDSTCEVKDGKVEVRRRLTISGGAIPPEQYVAAREFFGKISGSGRMPVVLMKK